MRINRRENRCKCLNTFNIPDYNALVYSQIMNDIVLYHNIVGKRPSTGAPHTVFEKLPPSRHLKRRCYSYYAMYYEEIAIVSYIARLLKIVSNLS